MKSIKTPVEYEQIINKSKFLSYLFHVESVEQVQTHLHHLKTEHPDATHHVFAYVLGEHAEIQKQTDDGEPAHTAGLPILEVLHKNDLTDVLCVVIRYYGGIKLGGGGLIRAYAGSAAESIKKATFTKKVKVAILNITAPIHMGGKLEGFLREHSLLIGANYDHRANYQIKINDAHLSNFKNRLNDFCRGDVHIQLTKTLKVYT